MVQNNQDRRAVRTEKAIRDAFQELLIAGERPIKVTHLAEKAGINRKTFYSHYETIDNLVQVFIQDVQNDLITRLDAHQIDDYTQQRGLLISVFVDFFIANRDFYTSILKQGEYWPVVQRVEDQIIGNLADRFAAHTKMSRDEAMLLVTFTSSPLLAMMRLKLQGEVNLSTTEIREKTEQLVTTGLHGANNDQIFR